MGQQATFTSDTYGRQIVYKAKVTGIGAAAGNLFTLLPPQNATGNWIKVVQRVPVRLEIDPETLKAYPLCIGSSVRLSIDTKERSLRGIFSGSSRRQKQKSDLFESVEKKIESELQRELALALESTQAGSWQKEVEQQR